jgi:hypothetical protein
MSPGWVGLIVGLFLGANGGVIAMGILAANARAAACENAYLRGLEKGRALAHANVMHDIIASDTASTGADRRTA